MPLAPLRCRVQVHEKTDQRGTWAFHSVDGWYLATSPEHYRTHRCHIKGTNSDRFSDTVQFFHKHITNPTLTHGDKVMHALADCAKALKDYRPHLANQELRDLRAIIAGIRGDLAAVDTVAPPRVPGAQRVPLPDDDTPRRVTRSMSTSAPAPQRPPPRVPLPEPTDTVAVPRVPPPRKPPPPTRRPAVRRVSLPNPAKPISPPAPRITRSRAAAQRQANTPPARNTRSQVRRRGCANGVRRLPRRASRRFQRMQNEVMRALAVMDKKSGRMLNYRQLLRHPSYRGEWSLSSANEFGRLANGVGGRIKNPTNTIRFIRKEDVPHSRRKDVTYGQFVCTVRPEKAEPNRTRFTVGGDRINYPGEVATPTADMLVFKLLLNSVVSTPGARFMTIDISNFYLMTPLKRPEYIRLRLTDVPEEIIIEYGLRKLATNDGYIYIVANRGMYGLPQAGLLANELLEKRLNKNGYVQSRLVPGLWQHKWRPIQFSLVVDDFGVKYVGREHADHLLSVLKEHYKVTTDWTGSRYIGIHLDWDYVRRRVHLSMPGYVAKALKQFGYKPRQRAQHAPFPHTPIRYGAKTQYATAASTASPLDKKGK